MSCNCGPVLVGNYKRRRWRLRGGATTECRDERGGLPHTYIVARTSDVRIRFLCCWADAPRSARLGLSWARIDACKLLVAAYALLLIGLALSSVHPSELRLAFHRWALWL